MTSGIRSSSLRGPCEGGAIAYGNFRRLDRSAKRGAERPSRYDKQLIVERRSLRSGRSLPRAKSRGPSVETTGGATSPERGEDFLDRLHLVAGRRGRHQDRRVHARGAPGGDALAHLGGRPEQRVVGQPLIGEEFR